MQRLRESTERRCGCRPYSLVLLDINMPGMSGLETAKLMLETTDQRIERPYIMGVSGDTSEQLRSACEAIGIGRVLAKPLEKELLEHVIRDMQDKFYLT